MISDLSQALKQLSELQSLLPAMQSALKERAMQEAVDGGAAIAVRPWSFRHPLKGECDPWFGLAYQDWLALRNEGFKGIYTSSEPTSERAKLFIIFDEATVFLKARAAAQAEALANRQGATARLIEAKGRRALAEKITGEDAA
jgi:hypothetical protein